MARTSASGTTLLMPPCVWVERLAAQQANRVMARISSTVSSSGALCRRSSWLIALPPKMKRGQRLLTFAPEAVKAAGHPTVTVVIVTNSDDYQAVKTLKTGPACAMDPVLCVEA